MSSQSKEPPGGANAALENALNVGTLISKKYRVKEMIGQGGMGLVALADDVHLAREVAIKMIRPGSFGSDRVSEYFLKEARAAAGVRHPNVVQIYEYGVHEGHPYFVMEHVPGASSAQWLRSLKKQRKLPPIDEVIGVLDQVCRGLDAIHAEDIVHADIKPANVLIGPSFRVCVTDFGLVRARGHQDTHKMVVGTPAYIAPEIVYSADAVFDAQVDLFALAVMAYEMFTLQLPFAIDSVKTLFDVHLAHQDCPPPSEMRSDLPAAFDEVILRGLSRDKRVRYASAHQFRRALLRARDTVSLIPQAFKILIADDDPAFLSIVKESVIYAFPGAECICVPDGDAAMAVLEREPIALAILDLDMPGMNGVELTAAIASKRAASSLDPRERTSVLVVSGTGGSADWQLLQQLGADGFLVKPLDPYALVAMARKALEGA